KPIEREPRARVAHLDVDGSEIRKVKKGIDWYHVSDARRCLADLTRAGKDFHKDFGPWLKHVRALKQRHAMDYNRTSPLLQPQEVLAVLNEIVRGEAIYTTGVGQH